MVRKIRQATASFWKRQYRSIDIDRLERSRDQIQNDIYRVSSIRGRIYPHGRRRTAVRQGDPDESA